MTHLTSCLKYTKREFSLQAHSTGHAVFFDFLGLFFVSYTETTGIILNSCIAAVSLTLVAVSLWRMARVSQVSLCKISSWFGIIFALHVLGMIFCLGLPLLMAILFDAGNQSLSYFTNTWLMFGLFICPAIIGLSFPTTLYYTLRKNVNIALSVYVYPNYNSLLIF